jgi:Lon protease-like protein
VSEIPEVIALFPLSQVLVPAMPLPLHVFEDRYHRLLADILAEGTGSPSRAGFGVVALRSGTEVAHAGGDAGTPDVESVGTFAEIVEVEAQADGTARVLAVGSRRFRICTLLPMGRPYLRAEVTWLEEHEGRLSPASVELTRALCDRMSDLIGQLTGESLELAPLRDPAMLSYQVAARVPLAPQDRQALLAAPTAAERLNLAVHLLRREIRLVQCTRTIAMSPSVLRVAPEVN